MLLSVSYQLMGDVAMLLRYFNKLMGDVAMLLRYFNISQISWYLLTNFFPFSAHLPALTGFEPQSRKEQRAWRIELRSDIRDRSLRME